MGKTKIKPKWGVAVFRDAVIGPVQFELVREDILGMDESPDPLNMDHWVYLGEDYECPPSRLFQNRKNAKLFADGARFSRSMIIEAWSEDMTEKFDTQAEK